MKQTVRVLGLYGYDNWWGEHIKAERFVCRWSSVAEKAAQVGLMVVEGAIISRIIVSRRGIMMRSGQWKRQSCQASQST